MSRNGKIALFIDGFNFYTTARALGFDVDYRRLLAEFQNRGTLLRALFYATIFETEESSTLRPLIDWLDYNGYSVVTKPSKEFVDAAGHRRLGGRMDVELAIDAMELAGHVDEIILFSGDGAFRPLIEALQRRGVRVSVVSSILTNPVMLSGELRRQADVFIDLKDLKSRIGREPLERKTRSPTGV